MRYALIVLTSVLLLSEAPSFADSPVETEQMEVGSIFKYLRVMEFPPNRHLVALSSNGILAFLQTTRPRENPSIVFLDLTKSKPQLVGTHQLQIPAGAVIRRLRFSGLSYLQVGVEVQEGSEKFATLRKNLYFSVNSRDLREETKPCVVDDKLEILGQYAFTGTLYLANIRFQDVAKPDYTHTRHAFYRHGPSTNDNGWIGFLDSIHRLGSQELAASMLFQGDEIHVAEACGGVVELPFSFRKNGHWTSVLVRIGRSIETYPFASTHGILVNRSGGLRFAVRDHNLSVWDPNSRKGFDNPQATWDAGAILNPSELIKVQGGFVSDATQGGGGAYYFAEGQPVTTLARSDGTIKIFLPRNSHGFILSVGSNGLFNSLSKVHFPDDTVGCSEAFE